MELKNDQKKLVHDDYCTALHAYPRRLEPNELVLDRASPSKLVKIAMFLWKEKPKRHENLTAAANQSLVPSTPSCRMRSGFIPAKFARFRAFSASSWSGEPVVGGVAR